MSGATIRRRLRPHEKQHKEYLCVLVLHSNYRMREIVSLLNRRFKRRMEQDSTRFDEAMTQQYWEHMEATNHDMVQWARSQGYGTRKVQAVLKWALAQEIC